jgi:hypothetical protein
LQGDGAALIYPAVRMAVVSPDTMPATLCHPERKRPSLLVSYVYFDRFDATRRKGPLYYRDWVLDSGAFSAHNSGRKIEIAGYLMFCREWLKRDPRLTEVFSLDVIGDWRASDLNTRKLWNAGIPAIPTFHYGEPFDVLRGLARDYPKVGIGGAVRVNMKEKLAWVKDVFAAVWPKKIHGLAMVAAPLLRSVPFHSVDASSWEYTTRSFAHYAAFNGATLYGTGGSVCRDQYGEIAHYLRLESEIQFRWRWEMEELKNAA